ncbi:MAG: gluconokinase, GntK/IdnK-type [Anaerolineae bacterium]
MVIVPFYDGDDYQPQAIVDKMSHGEPMTDADRQAWLDRLQALVERLLAGGASAVLACSALKRSYRQHLDRGRPGVRFVYLQGSYDLIEERMEERKGHFMPEELLEDQFETLEEPEDMLTVSIDQAPERIARDIERKLDLRAEP